jgi:hypothetical protein
MGGNLNFEHMELSRGKHMGLRTSRNSAASAPSYSPATKTPRKMGRFVARQAPSRHARFAASVILDLSRPSLLEILLLVKVNSLP